MTEPIEGKTGFVGPTFPLANRLGRVFWQLCWLLLARWTPPPAHKLRILLIRMFGGNVSYHAYVYPDVRIWAPWNLRMEAYATLARGVVCYNVAPVYLGVKAVVSQFTHLCTATHDYRDREFPLYSLPISIGRRAWVAANAFVGPGVTIGEGAVLGAGGVAAKALDAWVVYAGNPAVAVKNRPPIDD